jgi:hypothetical protein
MKREIKFRAKIAATDVWIFGLPYSVYTDNDIDSIQIIETKQFEYIKTDTLGQFTSLKDKNGNEIYEGDYDQDMQVVRWCDKRNGWSLSIYDFPTQEHICCHCYNCEGNYDLNDVLHEIEIIGNIYEKK